MQSVPVKQPPRHPELLWSAVVLAASFLATQIVTVIEFVAVH